MSPYVRYLPGVLIATLLIVGPLSYGSYRQSQVRNFHQVRDGVLYRSGQMSLAGLKRVVYDYGIKTVVSLRDSADPKDPPPDWDEEKYCKSQEIRFCRISPRSWWSPDGSVPVERGMRKFLAIMDNPDNYPVLIHCFAGVHRTGTFCAVYRMEYDRWTNADALEELRACGYRNLEDEWDLLDYLKSYRPRSERSAGAALKHPRRLRRSVHDESTGTPSRKRRASSLPPFRLDIGIDPGRQGLAADAGDEVVGADFRHGISGADGGAGDVRRDDHVG